MNEVTGLTDNRPAPVSLSAKKWQELLKEAERADENYHKKCDSIDKLYASLPKMAQIKTDREFQIFWANMEVLKPTVYSRMPMPAVTPRFKDRKPLPRTAADIIERALTSDFEADDVHETLKCVRDDLCMNARGVVWVRVGERDGLAVPIAEHVSRQDFRHEPARKWKEVGWVARRAHLTRSEVLNRFERVPPTMKFAKHEFGDDKETETRKAEIWEIWHKGENLVAWVSEDVEDVLDMQDPWVDLVGFFPCARPAYGTLERESLCPVPDFVFYKDQVEEINILTKRISGLTEALRLKGFYPAGNGEISEAIEAALKNLDDRATLVPVSSFSAMGGQSFDKSIIWLPMQEVAATIAQCVELRRVLIDDVYQITGISDIMRGETEATETLGAQQLKSQFGAIRVRDKQAEMARIARDVTRMKAEIMSEVIELPALLEMAQVDDIPTYDDLRAEAEQAISAAMAQGPEAVQQAQAEFSQMHADTVTFEQIQDLLQNQRVRPFVLDIETDSTIEPDQMAEKQQRVEFVGAIGGFIQQAAPLVAQFPQMGPLAAETLTYMSSGFRVGRAMDMAIDELADQLRELSKQPQRPDPRAEADRALVEAETALKTEMARKAAAETQRGAAPEPVSVDPLDVSRHMLEVRKQASDEASTAADIQLREQEIEARANVN